MPDPSRNDFLVAVEQILSLAANESWLPHRLESGLTDIAEDHGLWWGGSDYTFGVGVIRDLQLGMTATAEIKTEGRPIVDFILSPITKRAKEAGRER